MNIDVDEKTILAFHQMWDAFPGAVRLVDKTHKVRAANAAAIGKGHMPGVCCATVGAPESHRGCLAQLTVKTQTAQTDRPYEKLIRGWVPVNGCPDLFVHYTLGIPEQNNE